MTKSKKLNSTYCKRYYYRNREKILKQRRIKYKKNPQYYINCVKRFRIRHPNYNRDYMRKYRQRGPTLYTILAWIKEEPLDLLI